MSTFMHVHTELSFVLKRIKRTWHFPRILSLEPVMMYDQAYEFVSSHSIVCLYFQATNEKKITIYCCDFFKISR